MRRAQVHVSRGVLGVSHAVHQPCLAELPEGAQRLPRSVVCGGEARRGAPSEGSAPAGPGPGCGGEDLPPLPPLALEMAGAGTAGARGGRGCGGGGKFHGRYLQGIAWRGQSRRHACSSYFQPFQRWVKKIAKTIAPRTKYLSLEQNICAQSKNLAWGQILDVRANFVHII